MPLERLDDLNALRCTHCKEEIAVPRCYNPERRLAYVEMIEIDHRPCEQHDTPQMARAERRYRQAMERELARAAKAAKP